MIGFTSFSILKTRTYNIPETVSVSEALCFLLFRILAMDKLQKPINSECHTRLSEPFRFYSNKMCVIVVQF
jgi:hypothetical protein